MKKPAALIFITAVIFLAGIGSTVMIPESVLAAADACNNPYFPLRTGDEIEYKNSGAGGENSYTMKVLETTPGSAKIEYIFGSKSGVKVTQNLFCKDGRITTDTYMNMTSGTGGVEMRSDTEGVEGDLMPKDVKVGSTWTTKYTIASKIEGIEVPSGFSGLKMTVKSVNKVLKEEKVSVPAGTYLALKVEVVSSVDMSMPGIKFPAQQGRGSAGMPESGINSTTSATFYEWWVKGIGLIKVSSNGPSGGWESVATRISASGGIPFLDNPTVEAIAEKGVAPAAAAIAVANSAFAAQATLSVDVFRYLLFFLSQPLLLVKRRKRKAWGTVYNSLSYLPEDLVIVRLRDAASGKIMGSEVTDKVGSFSFLVPAGKYRLEALKANFVFPSDFTKSKKDDGQYLDLYHGETIEVGDEGIVITSNIPLDPAGKDMDDSSVQKKDRWHKIQGYVAMIGPALGFVSYVIKPSWLVGFLFVLGVVVYLFFRRFVTVPAPKNWGMVQGEQETKPVPGAVLRIFALPYDKLLESKVADSRGRYNFRVGSSKFYLTVTKDGYEKKQTELFDFSGATEPKVIAEDISIKSAKQ